MLIWKIFTIIKPVIDMDTRKTFIVLEDEDHICKEYSDRVKDHSNLFLVDIAHNASDAVTLVENYIPDAVVLDIQLNHGNGSGISFLDEIREKCPDKKPFVLVVTSLSSTYMHDRIREKGGDFIITKNKPDYSVDYVLDMIDNLVTIPSLKRSREEELAKLMMQREYSKRLKEKIATEMELLCMKPSLKGAAYLKEAIEINIEERQSNTYDVLAKQHAVTADSVEKAMRHAINSTWKNDIDMLLTHYTAVIDSERGAPTPTEFIYYYVDKIKREL